MSKSKSQDVTLLPVTSEIKLDTTIGTDEIVAIRVAEVERTLLEKQVELKAQRAWLKSEITQTEEKLASGSMDVAKAVLGKKVGALREALRFAGLKQDGDVSWTYCHETAGGRDQYTVQASVPGIIQNLRAPLTAKQRAPLVKLEKQREDLIEHVAETEEQMVQVKEDLRRLPTLERQVRAELARNIISASSNGDGLLAAIRGVTIPGIGCSG